MKHTRYMKKIESHRHFVLGENKQWFPDEEFIIHLNEPRCFIRYKLEAAFGTTYNEFIGSIAEIQWIDGKPSKEAIELTIIDAWNFLAIEERILENDIEMINEEDDF